MQKSEIDGGAPFDWGKTSADYARYRDIYPPAFYDAILDAGLCTAGQAVLDLGTGTGVLPRHLARHGARFTGVDISPEQIGQARRLSAEAGLDIEYLVGPAEALALPDGGFDVVTACQCFHYFDVDTLVPRLKRALVPRGRLAILYMEWLPFEDEVARQSEALVLKYSPGWTGAATRRTQAREPEWAARYDFPAVALREFDLQVPFTRESWNGRMRACRGVGASLPPEEVAAFEAEHRALLGRIAPERFTVLHQALMVVLENR